MLYSMETNYQTANFKSVGFSNVPLESLLSSVECGVMDKEDDQFYSRCRRAILLLNAQLVKAAEERSEFAPFLLEAMGNAVSELLEHGDQRDLLLLEQWLDEENQ